MIKKLSALILLTILFASLVTLGFYTGPLEASGTDGEAKSVALPMNAVLTVEDTIGDKHVEYFEHIIDDVIWVKNDYVLIHVDPDTNETVRYNKSWRDIELPDLEIKSFEPPGGQYFWKKVAVFLNEEDCGNFYTFYDISEYPLVCWEVRYIDGTTVLYDLDGCEIGEGVPSPSAFLLSGSAELWYGGYGDAWEQFRTNAEYYFQQWCDSTISVFDPTTEEISSAVSNPDTRFYYAIAHGGSTGFYADYGDDPWPLYYSAEDASQDMGVREYPMGFAFLGHCNAMNSIGSGTFSYEFRKGQMEGTVTVGYTNMDGDDGWPYADEWQDYMFQKMNEGLTVKESFDQACGQYPLIDDAVAFVGDENLTIMDIFPTATTVELSPETGENPVGEDHDLTATVYDQYGYELEDVAVTWSISGVGSFSGTPESQTDAGGEAHAEIISSFPGTSTVTCVAMSGITQVAAGSSHTVGVKSDGTVVAVGRSYEGQCDVGGWTDITQVAAGARHTVGLKSDGTVVAVGWNDYGQCDVGGWTDITQVAAGWGHTVGLKTDGTVVAVGSNYDGQCDVGGWTDIVQVAAFWTHTVGLKTDGTVVAVGWNLWGQCNVGGWTDITQVAAGFVCTVGLKTDGTVVAVGSNGLGQCDVGGWMDIVQIAAGGDHTVGLKSNSTVVAVGSNYSGQCDVGGWTYII